MPCVNDEERTSEAAERDPELVFAVAGPVGSDLQEVSRTLRDALKQCDYTEVEEISVTGVVRQIAAKRAHPRYSSCNDPHICMAGSYGLPTFPFGWSQALRTIGQ